MPSPDRLTLAFQTQALTMPESGDLVVLRATLSDIADEVGTDRLLCEQSLRPIHDELVDRDLRTTAHAEGPAGMVVVNLSRARAENLGNIARGLEMLAPGATLAVNGAKTDGVDSLARQVAKCIPLDGQMPKAHGRVFWLTRPEIMPPAVDGWAQAAGLRPNADGFPTAPGFFSPDHIDPGSRKLAAAFAGRLRGRVADLGAGWGWLSHAALEACPDLTQIDLFEADARALEAARAIVRDPRAGFHWSDVRRLGTGVPPYDAVITNPPFHQGRAAEAELGQAFIAAAARILKPSGKLWLVANRQLPYEAALDARFKHWERVSEDGVYKVVAAERPQREAARGRRE